MPRAGRPPVPLHHVRPSARRGLAIHADGLLVRATAVLGSPLGLGPSPIGWGSRPFRPGV